MSIQAQQYPVYQPAMRIVTNITNANPAVVTTSFAHQYTTGLIVRLILPLGFGMQQANQLFSDITVIDSTNFSINIDTTLFSPFTTPVTAPLDYQYAQCIPIGEVNSTVYLATKNVLPYPAN